MISSVTQDVGGEAEAFRLTTRAMMAVEDRLGAGIVDVMQGLESGFRIGTLAVLLAECANDGAGRSLDWAQTAIDGMGIEAAGDLVGRMAEAAFPQAAKSGNGKRARQSK